MEIAKLYKQGGSTVIALPQKYLQTLGWKAGEKIIVILQGPTMMSLIKAGEQQEFQQMAQKAIVQERTALDETDAVCLDP
jgi:antitoxin component of MazEF toxin-antitoxin module